MPSSDARAAVARLKQIFTSGTCRWCRLSVTQFPRIAQPYRLDQVRNRGNGPMLFMMTSSNGNIFRVTGHLCGEFTGPRWIPRDKGQWRGALMLSLFCVWFNGWVNNREAGDLRRYLAHYDVIVMKSDLILLKVFEPVEAQLSFESCASIGQ